MGQCLEVVCLFVLVVPLALRNDLLLEVRSAPTLPEDIEDYVYSGGHLSHNVS